VEIKIIKPTIKRKKFNLKGKTCNEIADELNKKSPGHFTAHPKFDIKMNSSDRSVKSVTLSADGTIEIPDWPKAKSLGEKTLKEWKRFQAKLEVHEEGHRLILLESMALIADEAQKWYDAKIEKGETPTGDELDEVYDNEWSGKYWDPPQDKYDTDTERGKTQGAWFEAVNCD
jgi:predicted secreted Zn-dependent protease